MSRRPSAILVEKRTESSAGVVLQLRLPQHADQHGPERPILLAVDQAFREDARLRWSKRGDGRVRPDGEGDTSPAIPIRPVVSSGRLSQTRPNGSCSICGCPVQTIRTRTECHVADGGNRSVPRCTPRTRTGAGNRPTPWWSSPVWPLRRACAWWSSQSRIRSRGSTRLPVRQ